MSEKEKVRAHVYISGAVQGVFFRNNTKAKADELGVFGFINNLPDGRVEALFEGEEDKAKELVDWCRQGPEAAEVEDVNVTWEDYTGEFREFLVH